MAFKLLERILGKLHKLRGKMPDYPEAHEIDREYIEGETPDEIGEISEMKDIPDKALRHVPEPEFRKSKRAL